jgi:hypothetical protein
MSKFKKAGFTDKTLFITQNWCSTIFPLRNGQIVHLSRDDGSSEPCFVNSKGEQTCEAIDRNIKELPRDQDGFYIWEGEAQPVPDDWVVEGKYAGGETFPIMTAKYAAWEKITAFRVISTGKSAPEWPEPEAEVPLSDAGLVFDEPVSAMDVQEGGDHYKSMPIQPMEFSMANGMDACQHTIIKYVSRFRNKGGIEDLKKAKHCIDMLIEFEVKALERGES